ncbi:hypothetical protein [Planctomicrobium sp. SH664]|uniref:hypothetical protein n=1 Tax=Planctomicrobium sp. SH664 TaxID=3448125 RepID=UPI003F5BCA42
MSERILLEWGRESVRVLTVSEELTRRAAKLAVSTSFIDHADPGVPAQEAGVRLRIWLDEVHVPKGKCTVVLPREAVVIRRLSLPPASPEELPEMVRFQAATKASAPIESLVLDYLQVPGTDAEGGQQVITMTVDRTQLDRITRVLDAAGLQVDHVTMSALTVAQLVRAQLGGELGQVQPDMVIYQVGRRVEFSIIDQGTLIFSHALQLPEAAAEGDPLKPLKSELTRSIVSLNQTHPQAAIERCFYVSGDHDTNVMQLLRQRFPRGFETISSTGALKGIETAGYESLVGAELPHADDRLRIDLLNPRRKVERPDRRKLYWGVGGALAALSALFGYLVFHTAQSRLKTSIQLLQTDIKDLEKKLDIGKPRLTDFDRLAKWKEKDADTIELWNILQAQLPGTDRIYFTSLNITPQNGDVVARYTGKAQARTRSDADTLNQALAENGFAVTPKDVVISNRDQNYPVPIDLDISLLRSKPVNPLEPAVAPATSVKTAVTPAQTNGGR